MDRTEIRGILVGCIEEIQKLNGLPLSDVLDSTCPVGDLEGFDSLIMIELVVQLSSLIGLELDDEIFYAKPESAQGRMSSLSIKDIVESIYQITISQKG
ncbi:acyl carrier protein [Candidatus Parvarchaeota archaeon]|nr:acyl carrier protein [Candidatus Parvarchaeota archaeon]